MEDNGIKALLLNFEKASSQLNEAVSTMESFSEKLNDYFRISKDTEKAISSVNDIRFDIIGEATKQVHEDASRITEAISALNGILGDHSESVSEGVQTFLGTQSDRFDRIEKSVKGLRTEVEKTQKNVAGLNEKLDSVIKYLESLAARNATDENLVPEEIVENNGEEADNATENESLEQGTENVGEPDPIESGLTEEIGENN